MEFEWDETKRRRNLELHKIDFLDMPEVFVRTNAVHLEDVRRNYGESRFVLMCEARGHLLHITYTMRDEVVRIISARHGNRRERRLYAQAQINE